MAGRQYGMAKGKSPSGKSNTPATRRPAARDNANDEGGKFVDRDLMNVNPLNEQFEPTDAEPVPQRYKMGGGS